MSDFKNNLDVMAARIKAAKAGDSDKGDSPSEEGDDTAPPVSAEGNSVPKVDENADKGNPVGVELTDEVVLEYVSKKLSRETSSFEDMYVEKVVEKEIDYAADFARKYDAFYRETKGSVDEFNFVQQDVDAKDDIELVREILSIENPDSTAEDIDFMIEDDFTYDEEFGEEKDIRRTKNAIKRKAAEAKRIIKERQEKFKVEHQAPETVQIDENSIIEKLQKKSQDDMLTFSNEWKDSLTKSVEGFDGVDLSVGEDFNFKYSSNDETTAKSFDTVADVTFNKLVEPFRDENGAVKQKELHNAIFKLQNFDSILKTAVEQAIEHGRELEIRKEVNPSTRHSQGNSKLDGKNLSAADKFKLEILNKAKRNR